MFRRLEVSLGKILNPKLWQLVYVGCFFVVVVEYLMKPHVSYKVVIRLFSSLLSPLKHTYVSELLDADAVGLLGYFPLHFL